MKYFKPLNRYARRTTTSYIVLHCADTENGKGHRFSVDDVRDWHVNENGWMDIGYHFFIREDGTLETGRPLWSVGAHVKDHNHNSVGVCMAGGSKDTNDFTAPQWRTLESVVATLTALYPTAEVLGHRDFPGVTKYCPSFDARDWFRTHF